MDNNPNATSGGEVKTPRFPHKELEAYAEEMQPEVQQRHQDIKKWLEETLELKDVTGFAIIVLHGKGQTRHISGGDTFEDMIHLHNARLKDIERMFDTLERLSKR